MVRLASMRPELARAAAASTVVAVVTGGFPDPADSLLPGWAALVLAFVMAVLGVLFVLSALASIRTGRTFHP